MRRPFVASFEHYSRPHGLVDREDSRIHGVRVVLRKATHAHSYREMHVQLLNFHQYLYKLYPPSTTPLDYTSRLLRSCLSRYSGLLETRQSAGLTPTANGIGGGKRGKKRARGAEDGLIGGLEGREARAISEATVEAVLASLPRESICANNSDDSRLHTTHHPTAFTISLDLFHPAPSVAPSAACFSIQDGLCPVFAFGKTARCCSRSVAAGSVSARRRTRNFPGMEGCHLIGLGAFLQH